MKRYFILFICFFISLTLSAQEISPKQQKVVAKFVKQTINHNEKGIFKLLEKDYRDGQLAFLKGNRKQLIDELFSGYELSNDSFVNSELATIVKIEIAEVQPVNENTWEYGFRVRDGKHDFIVNLQLIRVKNTYKFVGAVG